MVTEVLEKTRLTFYHSSVVKVLVIQAGWIVPASLMPVKALFGRFAHRRNYRCPFSLTSARQT